MMKKLREYLHLVGDQIHHTHSYAHLVYFGAVFVEGHGVYSWMGGILLVIGLLMLGIGEEA